VRSIAELRDEIRKNVTTDNIVEAIIYKVYEPLEGMILKSQASLQRVFFQIKKSRPRLFHNFIFDESGITPFSDELDSVFFRLEASAILSVLNPTYKKYSLKDSLGLLEASYKKLESQKEEIDKCAEIFCDLIKKEQV
jgi:hypothetical protein